MRVRQFWRGLAAGAVGVATRAVTRHGVTLVAVECVGRPVLVPAAFLEAPTCV